MLTIGNILDGRYHIRERIGDGGFGSVYLAEDIRFSGKNLVAVKHIQPRNETEAKALKNEADLLYNLSHPNLPKVSNCFQDNSSHFIVMDYVSGEDLWQLLSGGRKFEPQEVLQIADTVLDALEYLHSFPIFHRDIKPHNIKIDESGRVFLLDFGTAKGNLENDAPTRAGLSITGFTPFYAPLEQVLQVDTNSFFLLNADFPEKVQNFAEYSTNEQSDIYALGATLYHLLSGNAPHSATATLRARALWSDQPDPLPSITLINSTVLLQIAETLQKAMAVEPYKRFHSAQEFRKSLGENKILPTGDKTLSFADFINADASVTPAKTMASGEFQNSKTQILPDGKSFAEIPVSQDLKPLEEILPPQENTASNSNKKYFFALGTLFLFFLFLTSILGIWLAKDKIFPQNDAGENRTSQLNGANSAGVKNANSQNSSAVESIEKNLESEPKNSLEYSLFVQKMRDGKEYQTPFESSGQEVFESGYRFQMRLTPSQNGFLYLFNEGLNDKGEKVFQIIFPTPARNNGSAEVSANQRVETGWNEFRGQPGTENFWMIWHSGKDETLEKVKENAFSAKGLLTDKTAEQNFRTFLDQKNNADVKITKDVEKKLSRLQFDGDSAVYLILLEHR